MRTPPAQPRASRHVTASSVPFAPSAPQRFWERLINFLMGQLVVLGAVVEPDVAELLLWGSFAVFVGLLSLYSGLARDRLEYMAHLPNPPASAAFVRVVCLEVSVVLITLGSIVGGCRLMSEASISTLLLFFFPQGLLAAETLHALVHLYLQRRERHEGTSDTLYYASLVPELCMQSCRLCHQVHVWYTHGITFSIIDVLLLANAKLAFEGLHRRVVTHRNFLRADSNLQKLFRSATEAELEKIEDCCAICREPMHDSVKDSVKVLPCNHYFHCTCLRSWLEQSHSCPVCRAALDEDPATTQQHQQAATNAALNGGAPNDARAQSAQQQQLRRRRRSGSSRGERDGSASATAVAATSNADGALGGTASGGLPLPLANVGIASSISSSSSAGASSASAGASASSAAAGASVVPADFGGASCSSRTSATPIAAVERIILADAAATAAERRAAASGALGATSLPPPTSVDVSVEALMAVVPAVARAAAAAATNDRAAAALVLELAQARAAAAGSEASGLPAGTAMMAAVAAAEPNAVATISGASAMRAAIARALGGGGVQGGGGVRAAVEGAASAAAASAAGGGLAGEARRAAAAPPLEGEGEEDEGEFDGEEDDYEDDEFDDEYDGEEGEEGDEEEHSYLLFSSENWRWPSWLPRLHLEVIQRRNAWEPSGGGVGGVGGGGGGGGGGAAAAPTAAATTTEELAQLREVFPQATETELRRVLLASANVEDAIETLVPAQYRTREGSDHLSCPCAAPALPSSRLLLLTRRPPACLASWQLDGYAE